jgi:hypothetical protein
MNTVDQANALINRVMNSREFEVKRLMDEPLQFIRGGSVPFDIRANQECAWFKVLALSQQEAEAKVDNWLESQKEGWDD